MSEQKAGKNLEETKVIMKIDLDRSKLVREVLQDVSDALKEKGYNPTFHITGYLLSGDPAYITYHKNARNIIRRVERDEVLEQLLNCYLGQKKE